MGPGAQPCGGGQGTAAGQAPPQGIGQTQGTHGGEMPHHAWAPGAPQPGPAQAGYGAVPEQGGYAGPGFHSSSAGPGPYGPGPYYYHAGYAVPPMYPGYPYAPHGAQAAGVGAPPGMGHGISELMDDALKGEVNPSKLGRYFNDGEFIKGALVGAAVVLLLTDNPVRRALFSGTAKATEKVKESVGEFKQAVGGKQPEAGATTEGKEPESKSD